MPLVKRLVKGSELTYEEMDGNFDFLVGEIAGKAPSGHNHDGTYDPAGAAASAVSAHELAADPHPGYLTQAEGDAAYASASHNHDVTYAAASHNHDGTYAAAGHNHDGTYAAASHNHDTAYAKLETAYDLGATLTGATTVTLSNGALQYGTVTGAVQWTFSGAAAAPNVSAFTLELTNGGSATQTWPVSVDWDGGTAPTLTAAGVDILEFYTRDGGTTWRGFLAAADSK